MPIEALKWEYIERNMVEFYRGLHSHSIATKRFAMFSHWYYHPRLEIFAPSKFIGYPDTTHDNYDGWGDGGQTQRILRPYFEAVSQDEHEYYLHKLLEYANTFGYKISRKTSESGWGWIYKPVNEVFRGFIEEDPAYTVKMEDEGESFKEGLGKRTFVNKYERDPKTKKAAILIHGTTCMGCGFNFGEFYGTHGKGFIELHHLRPLSSVKEEHYVDPKEDIAVLCSNCHRMVHRQRNNPLTIEQLVEIVQSNKGK